MQADDYYPFGLTMAATSYQGEDRLKNDYKYNAGSEQEEETDWYDTPFRKFDAALGRFTGIDLLADITPGINPYQFGYNNPISVNDPTGLIGEEPVDSGGGHDEEAAAMSKRGPGQRVSGDFYNQSSYFNQLGSSIPGNRAEDYRSSFASREGYDKDRARRTQRGITAEEFGTHFEVGYYEDVVLTNEIGIMSVFHSIPQDEFLDVTEKFNAQLDYTEAFFSEAARRFDGVQETKGWSDAEKRVQKLLFFADQVGTGKPFDIKMVGKGFSRTEIGLRAIYAGETYRYDDFGNINYGFAARTLGLTLLEAIGGAGFNQTFQTQTPEWRNPGGFFDHSRDTEMIKFGFGIRKQ